MKTIQNTTQKDKAKVKTRQNTTQKDKAKVKARQNTTQKETDRGKTQSIMYNTQSKRKSEKQTKHNM